MQSFEHLITTRPYEIRAVFIADLHLSAGTEVLNRGFLRFVQDLCALPALDCLYILGDFLDVWLGDDMYLNLANDDKAMHWLTPILAALGQLAKKTQILFMHGNRDFAIRQTLCDCFGATLIGQPHILNANGHQIRLEHGDRLCTDDKAYQRYRKIIQNPMVSKMLLAMPLAYRNRLASSIKRRASQDKSDKAPQIMDVNNAAVMQAMAECDILLHGHTHRPAAHLLADKPNTTARLVLGDWRVDKHSVSAVVAAWVNDALAEPPIRLVEYRWRY